MERRNALATNFSPNMQLTKPPDSKETTAILQLRLAGPAIFAEGRMHAMSCTTTAEVGNVPVGRI